MARARARPTTHSLFFVVFAVVLLSSLATLVADGCPGVPSMTAEQACAAVCGTPHMRELCLRTLGAGAGGAAAVPVTRHAAAAVRGALGAYAATVAAATSMLDGGAVPADNEKAAYGDCMVGYGRARGAMARAADELAAGGCDQRAADLKAAYTAGLRGMDMCRRSMFSYPASPLCGRNIADRNRTLLAALLCSLVPAAAA